jgi:L-seryl-tRNA(Ser) seleniumtransferase
MANAFRSLPSVNDVLAVMTCRVPSYIHSVYVEAIRQELDVLRARLHAGESLDGAVNPEAIAAAVEKRIESNDRLRLRPVINATGIVLHTNLGRAPIPDIAARAAFEAARGYSNLEMDLETGDRSSRTNGIRRTLCQLTGAESATAVNNCAAATVLVLRALAAGREVIVSRGQLVEIGGNFRIPEIMGVSGATLREIGTTNITRIGDYERAINSATAVLLRVHQSNFRIHGFTSSPTLDELVALGRRHGLPVVDDIGSGAMIDLTPFGLPGEPVAKSSIAAGADVVLFSGDKLLGGPQAGIIVGRAELIEKIQRDPMMRAVRLDKMSLGALDATLRLYLDDEEARTSVPVLSMLTQPIAELRQRASRLAARLKSISGISCQVRDDETFAGGGSLPDRALPTAVVAVTANAIGETELARRLRSGNPPIIARVQGGELLLDVRTVFPNQEDELGAAMTRAITI